MSARYVEALERVGRVRGIRGALLVHAEDGLVVAEALLEEVDARAVAALSAGLVSRLRRSAGHAGLRPPAFVHLRGEGGMLLAVPAPDDLLVVAIADSDANVGLARLEMLEAAGRLG